MDPQSAQAREIEWFLAETWEQAIASLTDTLGISKKYVALSGPSMASNSQAEETTTNSWFGTNILKVLKQNSVSTKPQ